MSLKLRLAVCVTTPIVIKNLLKKSKKRFFGIFSGIVYSLKIDVLTLVENYEIQL
jgi:hypothetical protein